VTRWSKFDVQWSGVKFADIAALVQPRATARFVIAEGADYYTTNLPLEACMDADVMLADQLYGEPLSRDHGGPLRLIVPRLYAWKSAKFLRQLTFSPVDQPGYWEQRGYHRRGDPWQEERHG
jgi:DMSO/TMAO reductase YedYZ molybdopterin-dependent catalytic subunit